MLREVVTKYGKIKGLPASDPRITSFKGIPFAKPPVGENRFRAPQECDKWEGTLNAFEYQNISVQNTPGLGTDIYCREWHVDPEVPMGEDCLYLNIWTPAKKTDEKLPVLVWYFGGAFQWGYTSEMEFDGERLARRGIIVVTVNYRLNIFGFLAHPELTKEAPDKPTNFGLYDQQAGTRWVKENIAAFGGDPDNITIAGQSAGGGSVMAQITCMENKGLFNRAVILSGLIKSPYREAGIPGSSKLSDVEKWGEKFFDYFGIQSLEEARKIPANELLEKYDEFIAAGNDRLFPSEGGCFNVDDPVSMVVSGDVLDIPIMCGNTADEFLNFIEADNEEEFEKKARDIFGGDADIFLGFKNCHEKVSGLELTSKMVIEAMAEKKGRSDCYYYRFNPDIPGDDNPGSFHSCDLWFFFETLSKCSRAYVGRHYDLARLMCNYWVNFIKCGNPNGPDSDGTQMPLWLPYSKKCPMEMEFVSKGAVPKLEDDSEFKRFLKDKLHDYYDHLTEKKQAVNPYLPSWEYVPDGEPYVFGDRVYVYGSHDYYNGDVFCMGNYVCWSADVNDLGNWRYEGEIFRTDQEPDNTDLAGMLYAPDVPVGPDGRYYLYYAISNKSLISVAVCDTPAGKYEFYGHVKYEDGTPIGQREGDEHQFDPGVLTEGEETYLYTGFCDRGNKSRHGAMFFRLDKDMLTVKEGPKFVVPSCMYSEGTGFEGHEYFEAASIRKIGSKYVFVYSSIEMHELCYAVSDRPDGDYIYGGVLVSNSDLGIDSYKPKMFASMYGANNHGSIIEINGKWYVFYHRHTNGTWYSRQVCAEELKVTEKPELRIEQAEVTSCGLNGGPLKATGFYPAYIACNLFYLEDELPLRENNAVKEPNINEIKIIQNTADYDPEKNILRAFGYEGDSYIANFGDKATAGFKYFDIQDVKNITVWMRGYGEGEIEIRTAIDGEVVGRAKTRTDNIWKRIPVEVSIPNGVHALYITYRGSREPSFKGFSFN